MVGDQVMSSAPRTIEGILTAHGASIETLSLDLINRYKLAGDTSVGVGADSGEEQSLSSALHNRF